MTRATLVPEWHGARIIEAFAPLCIAGLVGVAAAVGQLPLALGLAAFGLLLLVGIRSPVLVLCLFAALIPFEEALSFAGAGTATRLLGITFALCYVLHEGRLPRATLVPIAGWAYVMWVIASGLWVVDSSAWQQATLTLVQLFAIGLLVADVVSRDASAARPVLWAYSAGALVSTFILFVAPTQVAQAPGRLTALSGQDPAYFSAVLIPACLFLIYEGTRFLASRDRRSTFGLLTLCSAGILSWGILISGTRSALVGLGVGLAVLVAAGTGFRWGRLAVATVGVGAAAAALLLPNVADLLLARLSIALSTGGAGRQDIWAVGGTIFWRQPIVGVGFAGFPSAFSPEVVRASAIPGLDFTALTFARAPHSLLVGTAAELGIIGLVLLGAFLWQVVTARSDAPLIGYTRAALIAMIAQAMFLDLVLRKQLWLVLGLSIGLAAAGRIRTAASASRGRTQMMVAGDRWEPARSWGDEPVFLGTAARDSMATVELPERPS